MTVKLAPFYGHKNPNAPLLQAQFAPLAKEKGGLWVRGQLGGTVQPVATLIIVKTTTGCGCLLLPPSALNYN